MRAENEGQEMRAKNEGHERGPWKGEEVQGRAGAVHKRARSEGARTSRGKEGEGQVGGGSNFPCEGVRGPGRTRPDGCCMRGHPL